MSTIALENYLAPLSPFLMMDGVTEICINRPQEIMVEKNSLFQTIKIEQLTVGYLETLAHLVAEFNHQTISPEKPLLSASLLNGERAQFVLSPACEKDKVIASIRRHQMRDMTLEHYQEMGAFHELTHESNIQNDNLKLRALYQKQDWMNFITTAIHLKKNIIISGGTGTGKTTFLNACLKCIPINDRLITIEDTREVVVEQSNAVHLLASKGDQGLARITIQDLFECCLRLRPDRIFLSELRGKEAFAFLRAVNSGHPGSLSTIHADTPEGCFNQLVFMMQQAGTTSSDEQILAYIKSIIPIVIQLKRSSNPNRFMTVSEVYYDASQ